MRSLDSTLIEAYFDTAIAKSKFPSDFSQLELGMFDFSSRMQTHLSKNVFYTICWMNRAASVSMYTPPSTASEPSRWLYRQNIHSPNTFPETLF